MTTSSRARAALTVLLLVAGCGGDDDDDASTDRTELDETTTTTPTDAVAGGASVEPLPSLPDPAPALACDGSSVLCVDGAADADAADGTGGQPFASVGQALDIAEPGATVQVAAGVYEEALVIAEAEDLRLVGGFASGGDFSVRDASVNETVLQGNEEASVIELTASSGIHVEGLRLTGGGGRTDGYGWYGGGIYIDEASTDIAIVGNRIDGNHADRGDDPGAAVGGGIASYGTTVAIAGNVIEGNSAGRGAGIAAIGQTTIEGNTVRDNVSVGDHGGGLYLAGEVEVTGNRVEGNRVGIDYSWGGGIIVYGDDTSATLRANVVTDNLALSAGSGVFVDDGADATLVGELYYANRCAADGGSGLLVDSGGETPTVVEVVNATIARHDCPDPALGGNAILAEISEEGDPPPEVTVTNSILWGNAGSDVLSMGASVDVTYSLVEEAVDGEGNVSDDPRFVDPARGDFRLEPGSPAVDAGDPASTYDAEPDPNGGRIDLGHTGNTAGASGS